MPGARAVSVLSEDGRRVLAELEEIDPAGLFCGPIPHREERPRYRLRALAL